MSAEPQREAWVKYLDSLCWAKGEFDGSGWLGLLRAASCGIPQAEAFEVVTNRIRAAGGVAPARRLTSQARRAYAFVGSVPAGGSSWRPRPGFEPKREKPKFDDAKLKAFAAEWREIVTPAWLGDRSSLDPALVTSGKFLEELYELDERVLLFSIFQSQGQMFWQGCQVKGSRNGWSVLGADLGGDYTETFAEKLSGPEGVWFLAQPVDGLSHPNPRSKREDGSVPLSRRSMESVTSWRYLVVESDTADARDWLGAMVQLPLRIVAIYTSGGKSIHALVRVDAASKAHWDAERDAMLPVLVTLGADPAALTAVRLTRLPGCYRGDRLQKLLYLNPRASGLRPICALPPKRDVMAEWTRYAEASRPGDDDCVEWWRSVGRATEHYGIAVGAEKPR